MNSTRYTPLYQLTAARFKEFYREPAAVFWVYCFPLLLAVAPPLVEGHMEETGNRYIDFLLPGMLGMNLLGGGLWGVGYALADMRVRKLLKRFLATPMRRRDFLLSVLISRMLFTVPEVLT